MGFPPGLQKPLIVIGFGLISEFGVPTKQRKRTEANLSPASVFHFAACL